MWASVKNVQRAKELLQQKLSLIDRYKLKQHITDWFHLNLNCKFRIYMNVVGVIRIRSPKFDGS